MLCASSGTPWQAGIRHVTKSAWVIERLQHLMVVSFQFARSSELSGKGLFLNSVTILLSSLRIGCREIATTETGDAGWRGNKASPAIGVHARLCRREM
jgi:hypothetical protein